MRVINFPVNCSVTLHTDFGNTLAAEDRTNYTPEQVSAYLKSSYGGIQMITLNEEQDSKIGKAVRSSGFRCIKKTKRNGNHGQKILFFIKEA